MMIAPKTAMIAVCSDAKGGFQAGYGGKGWGGGGYKIYISLLFEVPGRFLYKP